jgi:uncharacterized hydrophobic protein (TIGR00341 family)
MTLRMLEVLHPHRDKEELLEFLTDVDTLTLWQDRVADNKTMTRIVLESTEVDFAIEAFTKRFGKDELKIIILPIQAYYPRKEITTPEDVDATLEGKIRRQRHSRASIEEIYNDATDMAVLSGTNLVMIALAAIVASVGLHLDDVAVIIGSMVIAPLLGPNLAFTLAVTLGDSKLARISLLTSLVGYILAIVIGVVFGLVFDLDPNEPELLARTDFSLAMTLVALSAGVAGALSFAQGVPQSLVGVMVAVALLPPLVAIGLFLGSANWNEALGAFLLFAINVISINLAGVTTFSLKGVTPNNWWEKDTARRFTQRAITTWTLLLIVVVFLVFMRQRILGLVP